jgi:iron-sulfur cluster assembly accessory protein
MQTDTTPIVAITEAAAAEVQLMRTKPENEGKHLRLYVEQGGCSGMQYGMTFDEAREGDHRSDMHGVILLVDDFSAKYLQGTVVDFSDALTGGGFRLTNPNAKQSCGCGKSFEV